MQSIRSRRLHRKRELGHRVWRSTPNRSSTYSYVPRKWATTFRAVPSGRGARDDARSHPGVFGNVQAVEDRVLGVEAR
jgi:hypothetical protein